MYKRQSELEQGVKEMYNNGGQKIVREVDSFSSLMNIVRNTPFTVVDVYATWCGPCKSLAPKYEMLANKYKDRVTFLKIELQNIENQDLVKDITALPTFLFFKNNGQTVGMHKEVGISIVQLEQYVQNM
jgi:thioredoxin 1